MGPMPDTPSSSDVHSSSAVLPMGVTAPSPVTTTRRLSTLCASPLLVLFDVGDGVADRGDLLRILVGNLEVEFLLECHHQLHRVERVRPEVLDELGIRIDLLLLDSELLADDFLHPLLHRLGHEHLLASNEIVNRTSRPPSAGGPSGCLHVQATVDVNHLPGDVAR